MNRPTKLLIKIVVAAAALVAVLAIAAVLVVQTDWFRQYVKNKIITAPRTEQAEELKSDPTRSNWSTWRASVHEYGWAPTVRCVPNKRPR